MLRNWRVTIKETIFRDQTEFRLKLYQSVTARLLQGGRDP